MLQYVALTPEELDEWQSDPESYARYGGGRGKVRGVVDGWE